MKLEISAAECLPQVLREMQYETERQRRAVIAGVNETGASTLRALREMMDGAFKGHKIRNIWHEKNYRNDGFDAAAYLYNKASGIIKAFSEGAVIRAHGHRFLAVKTENCPKRGTDGRSIRLPNGTGNPGNWPEDRYGPLRLVKRPGRVWLLVVDNVRVGKKSGRVRRLGVLKATKTMGERVSLNGRATVVMFVLLPQVTLKKRIDPNAVVKREASKAPENILRNLKG